MKKCAICKIEKPLSEFGLPKSSGYYHAYCRPCNTKNTIEYFRKNPIKKWAIGIKYRYGITEQEYHDIWESQGYSCAICGTDDSERRFDVDHDKVTGKVRGILCNHCNIGIGNLNHNSYIMRKAADYIDAN